MKSARKLFLFFLLFIIFLLSSKSTFAAFSFSIDSIDPNSISSKSDEITVKLSIADLPSESYFRVAWQKEGSKQYFGYVKNNNEEWIKIQSITDDKNEKHCTEYYKVTDTNTISLSLITKPGDNSGISAGTYYIKAHRFTSTCATINTADNNGSEETKITVNIPTSTPLPPTSTIPPPTNTPPTNTSVPATNTPIQATKMPTKVVSPRKLGSVLGEKAKEDFDIFLPTASPSASPTASLTNFEATAGAKRKKISYIFFGLGALAFAASVFSAYRISKSPHIET